MVLKLTNVDMHKRASEGIRFIGDSAFSLLGGNINGNLRKERMKELAVDIKSLLRKKKTISIPEIMKNFHVNATDAIDAVEILREAGMVKKVKD